MKRVFRTYLWIMLVLMMAFINASSFSETIIIPDHVTIIDEEVFEGTRSFDKVTLPDGVREIREKAFANSGIHEITIPESVEFIAEDAFSGCDNLIISVYKKSYAHEWAAFHDVEYIVLDNDSATDDKKLYELNSLELDYAGAKNIISVSVTNEYPCTVRFSVLDDGSEHVLFLKETEIDSSAKNCHTQAEIEETLPEYFVLEAVLLDKDGNMLTKPIRDITHTKAYIYSENTLKDQYIQERVMDFGDAGFAVLSENVIKITSEGYVKGRYYTFKMPLSKDIASTIPQKGDILMLKVNGTDTPIKAASVVFNEDNTVTVEADSELYLSDVYDKIEINTTFESDSAHVTAEAGNVFNYDETFSYGDGLLTLDVDCGMSINAVVKYDKWNLGKDYFLFDTQAKVWGGGTLTLDGEYATKENEIKLNIYNSTVIVPGINLPADLAVTIPVNAAVGGTGVVDIGFDKTIGFSWDTDNGFIRKEDEGNNWARADLEVNFNADLGPEISLTIGFWEFFKANVTAKIGIEAVGNMYFKAHIGYEEEKDADEIHACASCLNVDVDIFAKADVEITYKIGEEVKDFLPEKEIFNISGDLMELYTSFVNEKESIFEGVIAAGVGACPNYVYAVNISTVDLEGKSISGLDVSLTGTNGYAQTFKSPGKVYLYDADYTAQADFGTRIYSEKFSVIGKSKSVTIREREAVIEGLVVDSNMQTPISGAKVVLTLPDGTAKTAVTDYEGRYMFNALRGGVYSITVSKEDYKTKSHKDLNYPSGSVNKITTELVFDREFPSIFVEYVSDNNIWRQLKTSTGTTPDDVPEVFLKAFSANGITTMSVKHEDCKNTLEIPLECKAFYFAKLSAADMKSNEYIYHLNTEFEDKNGNYMSNSYVFRVSEGSFVMLREFIDGSEMLLKDISVEASFTSGNICEGILYPTGTRFVITTKDNKSSRIGKALYTKNHAYMYGHLNLDNSLYYDEGKETQFCSVKNVYAMKNGELTVVSQSIVVASGIGTVTYP